jgi:hypothetical protein
MPTNFTPALGTDILQKITSRKWKVVYEYRNHCNPDDFQPIEDVFAQEVESLKEGPRYHIYPAEIPFEIFINGVINETLQIPRVIIGGKYRLVFGFGIRGDHCYFVTNIDTQMRTADREPKSYNYMLDALDTLDEFCL